MADAEKAVMFTELTLTHACEQTIAWSAGAYLDRKDRAITDDAPSCGGERDLRLR